jgi:hypothetical protein
MDDEMMCQLMDVWWTDTVLLLLIHAELTDNQSINQSINDHLGPDILSCMDVVFIYLYILCRALLPS